MGTSRPANLHCTITKQRSAAQIVKIRHDSPIPVIRCLFPKNAGFRNTTALNSVVIKRRFGSSGLHGY